MKYLMSAEWWKAAGIRAAKTMFQTGSALPQLIELWGLNVQTEVESRKNLEKVSGK